MTLGLNRACLGCGKPVPGTRCRRCQARRESQRDGGATAQRGLGAAWQAIARQVIAEDGACRDCGHTGSPDNPLTCDHVVPRASAAAATAPTSPAAAAGTTRRRARSGVVP